MKHSKDIFISYKNDGEGNNFAARLCENLEKLGYDVYYNPNEQHAGSFPERLRKSVGNCRDFLLIVTQSCLDQLIKNEKVDWVREELLTAHENNKNIIPLLMPGVTMPKDKAIMPAELQFLPDADAISMTKTYDRSPLSFLLDWMESQPANHGDYKHVYQSNDEYDVNDDFRKTLELAQNGDPKAMYEIGNMYFYGIVDDNKQSQRDFAKAFEWFKKASETEGEYGELAFVMLGKLYYRGVVPREKQSYAKAYECYKKASNVSGYAKHQLSFMSSLGLGCEYDYGIAEECYLSIIESGDNLAINGLAGFYIRYGEYEKAAALYNKILNSFPKGAYELGKLYMQGVLNKMKQPDYFKAAFYFQHAINAGYCEADVYYQLGLLYFRGSNGFMVDYRIAQENFKIASDIGHSGAQYMLGYMYEHGHVEMDLDKAIKYHTLAAEHGHVLSPVHLAVLHQMPKFQNYQKAFAYAKNAAENGDKEGEYVYATFLLLGRGCNADVDKAYEYFSRSYNHGFEQAKLMIEKIDKIKSN